MAESYADPPYLERLLRWAERLRAAGHTGPMFMHLGDFEPGSAAAGDSAALVRAQTRLNDRVLELAGAQPGHAVLDVGCGLGGTLAALAARDASLHLLGLDRSAALLHAARIAGARQPTLRGDACALPFAAGSFDRVLAVECIFHFASRARFLSEAARVLAPSGRLVLTDFVPAPGAAAPDALDLRALVAGNAPWPDPWCAHGSTRELAAAAGLRLAECIDATRGVLPTFATLLERLERDPDAAQRVGVVDLGTAALGRLLASGQLRMELLAFDAQLQA